MKILRTPDPSRPRVAQPTRGTAWSVTDEALAVIDDLVARHEPERGGAVVSLRGSRLVVDLVADPRPGEAVSYFHSDELRAELGSYLRAHPRRRYAGTLHSHPGGYAEPSGPDHEQYRETLEANPSLRDALFPIVVGVPRRDVGSVQRLGERHLADLEHGTFAAYSAHPDASGTVEVRPAPVHVVPLRRDSTSVVDDLRARGGSVAAGPTSEIELEGRCLPVVTFETEDGRSVPVVFGETYPSTPPVLLTAAGPVAPRWESDGSSAEQLAAALWPHLGTDAEGTSSDRLTHHLPGGVSGRVLVVGAGSVGSTGAEMLVRSGVRDLVVVDFDTVDVTNLSRSVYERRDVGRPKVEALGERLSRIEPDVRFRGLRSTIQDLDPDLLDGVSAVLLATDDLPGEMWWGHHLYGRGIPSVSVKMFARGDAGEVVLVDPARATPCLHCLVGDVTSGRGEADYGTGRIVAAPALGPDITATVARGVKLLLGLVQGAGPLADLVASLATDSRTYFQQSNVEGWRDIVAFRSGAWSRPFDSMWVRGGAADDCLVCGPDRLDAPPRPDLALDDLLPPGVASGNR